MPGYIHTCEHCGAHMQVHERYLGRTLRCTSCRAEFLAMLPADAVVEEPRPPEVELPAPERSRARHLKWLVLLLLPLVVLMWWLGQDQSDSFLGSHRSWGEIGVLDNDSDGPVVVALDPESAMVLYKGGGDGNGGEARSLIERGLAFEASRGTSVRVLDSDAGGKVVRVRIISGPWESRKVWVPTRWIR